MYLLFVRASRHISNLHSLEPCASLTAPGSQDPGRNESARCAGSGSSNPMLWKPITRAKARIPIKAIRATAPKPLRKYIDRAVMTISDAKTLRKPEYNIATIAEQYKIDERGLTKKKTLIGLKNETIIKPIVLP